MQAIYVSKENLLRSLAGFTLNQGQNSVLANAGNFMSKPFSTLSCSIRPFLNALDLGTKLPPFDELITRQMENLSPMTRSFDLCHGRKCIDYCRRASAGLRSREVMGVLSNSMGINSKPKSVMEPGTRDFHVSRSLTNSARAASEMLLDGFPRDGQLGSSTASSDQKSPGDGALKLLSASCYLPHPDKEETGGEDAHFICVDEQAIGVADGVGGWADVGVDAGLYSRELMSHSVTAIQEEPKGFIDPVRVLEKAYASTKSKGSSTACIITLTNQGIRAVNLGDSGFIVVREGCNLFRSPVQQHDFNFPYQLESGNGSDLPSAAQVFTIPIASGDIIVAGTDGLFDNLYSNEVTAVVVHGIRARLGPHVTAQKIAALARQRAQDKNRQTPFSTTAQNAGYRYYGGKLDDITVIVSYITAATP
ncbi:uncharacterized protein A4U43_C03F26140 [Asparagus officinalis]|uniref:Protein phosphatase n=1 Tax=Asparagus officinalis TaxID=4686 RepID=A0A5P1FD51_ASPOF|nr:probable protein phosphatase 2C 55 [Asparagus officinalis]ONK76298.1 uncharacterized protein A4U43_C03F26140 [Asparagus officinalis]